MKLRFAPLLFLPLAAHAAADDLSTLSPAYGEMPMPFWEHYGSAIVIAGLALLIVAGLLTWLILRPKPTVPPAPEAVARAALAKLQGQPETGLVLSEISRIVRHYTGAAFNLSPGEPTTTEFLALIASHEKIGADLAHELAVFMRECDERKFSAHAPTIPLNGTVRARQLIAQAEQRRRQNGLESQATATATPPAPR